MLNIVPFGAAVLEQNFFLSISYVSLCKSLSPWGGDIDDPRVFI